MVLPHLTENYGFSRDPPEKEAPQCAVHNFPHNIDQCLVLAQSEFVGALGAQAKALVVRRHCTHDCLAHTSGVVCPRTTLRVTRQLRHHPARDGRLPRKGAGLGRRAPEGQRERDRTLALTPTPTPTQFLTPTPTLTSHLSPLLLPLTPTLTLTLTLTRPTRTRAPSLTSCAATRASTAA